MRNHSSHLRTIRSQNGTEDADLTLFLNQYYLLILSFLSHEPPYRKVFRAKLYLDSCVQFKLMEVF